MSRKYFILCLICALWTILQTGFHLVFVVYTYFMSICKETPTEVNSIFFYLTYSYNSECPPPKLKNSTLEKPLETFALNFITKIYSNQNTTLSLEEVVNTLLENLDSFPTVAIFSSRTSVFLLCFIILDGAWIVSAVSLLMGTCFGIKESLSLAFYGPWLVMTICVSIFDATASVFFGFDFTETLTFSTWLQFVGISNNNVFPDFDSREMPRFLTTAPALALCSVSSRFILIWISNWICFILVMKATISVYRESYKNEESSRPHSLIELPNRHRVDPDTSAARIRSWQLFYGAIDTTSSHSSKSDKDLNSNSKEGIDNGGAVNDLTSPKSGDYFPYPDVADSVAAVDGGKYLSPELRGQLPWSYIQPSDGRENREEKIELEIFPKRTKRLKSDSSSSGTEL